MNATAEAIGPVTSAWAPATTWKGRLVAAMRACLYVLLAVCGALLLSALLKAATGRTLLDLSQAGLGAALLRAFILLLALVVMPTMIMLHRTRERPAQAGWSATRWSRLFGSGVAAGLALMSALAVAFWIMGMWSPSLSAASLDQIAWNGLLSALVWLGVGAQEEGLDRGYVLAQLSRALSFWPAAIVTSLWFMLGHAANDGETEIGLLASGAIALVLAYSVLRSGSLWFAIGFHFAWNFAQSFLFGFATSGGLPQASLLSGTIAGPPLLSGGSTGPEGSLLVIPAILILAALVHFGLRTARQEPR